MCEVKLLGHSRRPRSWVARRSANKITFFFRTCLNELKEVWKEPKLPPHRKKQKKPPIIYILNAWKYSAFNLHCESLFSAHSFECREWIHMDKCTVVVRSHSLHLLCMSLEEVPSQLTSTACDFWRFIFQAFIYISKCLHLNGQKLEPPNLPLPKSLATTEMDSWIFETLRFRKNKIIALLF